MTQTHPHKRERSAETAVTVGSVWRMHDSRFDRYVKILAIKDGKAEIENVDRNGAALRMECRTTRASIARFGNAYKLIFPAPTAEQGKRK